MPIRILIEIVDNLTSHSQMTMFENVGVTGEAYDQEWSPRNDMMTIITMMKMLIKID